MHAVNRLLRHALAATLVLPAAALAQPQGIPGTRVTLQPPAGFAAAGRFPGFMHEASGSSIMVTELPTPAGQMLASFTREGLASRGMQLRSSEPRTVDGRQGVLLAITQSAAGTVYEKWMLGFGDDSTVVLVTGTYPQARAAELSEPVKQAVLSARRNAAPSDPLQGLGYRIDPGPRLRIATRVGNMLLINETGTLPTPTHNSGPGAPILVVASSLSPADLSDLEAFSRGRVTQIEQMTRVSNVTGGPVTIDGTAAYEVFADAVETQSSTAQRVYQVIIPDGDHYVIVQGMVGADRAADWIPHFQAVGRSLRRTR